MPVSRWLVDAIEPQPGHRVLELAAGPGDTGFLAAELIAPGGTLICSDFSETMLEVARGRASELGIANVEFTPLNAEWIDLPAASQDSVLCRWGYMLVTDPAAALRETRRVLRPGGRVALAAWADPAENPWAWRANGVAFEQGLIEDERLSAGMFAWSAPGLIEDALADAGFTDPRVEQVAFENRYPTFAAYWDSSRELATAFSTLVDGLSERSRDALQDGFRAALAPYTQDDGGYVIPAKTHVATAEA
jgi:ubiquinone/menaquinone biosynthesis C-methylase UbiE